MNSKGIYNRCNLPRLVIEGAETDFNKQQGESTPQSVKESKKPKFKRGMWELTLKITRMGERVI